MTEIKHAQRELERANVTKKPFLAIIAHDLRGGIFCAPEEVMTCMRVPSRKTGDAPALKRTYVGFFNKKL
jgi:light-regulated signal transduction histidine kinase (bacteriophytochrome)